MIVCIICGAISSDDLESEKHFNRQHLGREEPEDEIWIDYDKHVVVLERRREVVREVIAEVVNA